MKRNNIQLSTLLTMQIVAMVVLITAGFGGVWYSYTSKSIERASLQRLKDVSLRVQTVTNMHLAQIMSIALIAKPGVVDALLKDGALTANGSVAHEIRQIVLNSPITPYIYIGSAQGEFLGLEAHKDSSIERKMQLKGEPYRTFYQDPNPTTLSTSGLSENKPYDARTRPWYVSALKFNHPVWSPAYTSFSRKTFLTTLSTRLDDNSGKLLGVIAIDYELSRLSKFLRELPLTNGGAAFLIENNGDVLALSDAEDPYAGDKGQLRVKLSQLKNTALQASALVATTENLRRVTPNDPLVFQTKVNGKDYDVIFVRLDPNGGQQWIAGVAVARDDLVAIVKQPVSAWIVALLAVMLIMIMLTIAATRGIRREINVLTRFSERISAEDDFEDSNSVLGLSQSQNKELGELARQMQNAAVRSRERSIRQINEKKIAQLRSAEFQTVLEQSADATAIFDEQGQLLYANPSFWQLTGVPTPEVDSAMPAMNLFERMQTSPEHGGGGMFSTQAVRVFVHERPNGERYMAECLVFPIALPERQTQHFGLIERDVTERYVAQRKLETASTRDALTGLYNRSATMDQLITLIEKLSQAPQGAEQLAVMYLDLNHFKLINDQHGHSAGDTVLKQIIKQLLNVLPAHAVFGRWGGDEFLIVLPQFEPDPSEALQKAIETACRLDYTSDDSTIHISAAIGMAIAPNDGYMPQKLIELADARMFAAKALLKRDVAAQNSDVAV